MTLWQCMFLLKKKTYYDNKSALKVTFSEGFNRKYKTDHTSGLSKLQDFYDFWDNMKNFKKKTLILNVLWIVKNYNHTVYI